MKVTVAFGDVKVVVPCGHGDITIRQLSELAVTRYLKSLHQEKKSQRMFVNINALVLARDFGILDWDDNVSDVVDDRELIIARFQNNPVSYSNSSNNSLTGATTMASGTTTNHYHLCSEWGNCLPIDSSSITTSAAISAAAAAAAAGAGDSISYNFTNAAKSGTIIADNMNNQYRVHNIKNGSSVPVSTNSIDSYNYNWKASSNQCRNVSSEKKHFQKGKSSVKKRLSIDEIDSSPWPVPPPLIDPAITASTALSVAETDNNTADNITAIFTKSIQHNPLSLTYFSYPYSHSLSTDSDVTKKPPLMNMTKTGNRGSSELVQAPSSSLSSSLPSNADAKSMPQSYYSSLESTAVSDGNNSSYDDCQRDDFTGPSILGYANQTEFIDNDGKIFHHRKNPDSSDVTGDMTQMIESQLIHEALPVTVEPVTLPDHCELSDIQEEESSIRSKTNPNPAVTFRSHTVTDSSNRIIITSPNFQLPPPMPPLRSAFTKLSPKPLNIAFQSLHVNSTMSSSDCHLDSDTVSDLNSKLNAELSEIKQQVNLSKSEHSIPSLFDSEVHMVEDLENEWSVSERSADLESLATTTETSVHTTTTATNSFNTSGRNDNLTVTLTKSSTGFGFSLTSRHNPVDLTNPVYVSKVLENGPAIFDGRMKAGDRILMINGEDVRHLSQKSIKEILLNIPAETSVKIGLCRPNSDAISNILGASNTSTMQKKNSIPSTLNHTGDELNDECNQISVEEQKPVSFPMCTCVYKQSLPCSKLNLYHFIIPQRPSKSDYLSPQFIDRPSSDTMPKSLDIKTEPPAIQLHHQNKLSPGSFPNKQSTNVKHPNATLGISVRRGISQMSFNDSQSSVCHNTCRSQTGTACSSKKINPETSDNFPTNNYYGNFDETSSHKFCPNCHGLLSLKHGVFVKAIIAGGAAHMDGRLVNGDEIIAVQGICLYNGEEFLSPNNKVLLGDSYESLKFAQMSFQFQNRSQIVNTSSNSNLDASNRPDPLNLLKQILNHAQCTSNSVSLIILRRSLEKRSCSINTLASVDTNYCHNVTVAADVHTQYRKEDMRGDLFNFVRPHLISSNDPSAMQSSNREKNERFDEFHNKDHHQRYYRNNSDDSPEHNTSTNLICLESEHESDDQFAANSDNNSNPNNSNPNNSPNNNVSLAESYHVSSGILTDFESECVPIAMKNKNKSGSVINNRVDSLVNFSHPLSSSSPSCPSSARDNNANNQYIGSNFLSPSYFSRVDTSRQSFSLKRLHLNPEASSRMSRLSLINTNESPLSRDKGNLNVIRPRSELILSKVEEESHASDNSDYDGGTQTIDRRVSLKRRKVIRNVELDKLLYEKLVSRSLHSIPSQDD